MKMNYFSMASLRAQNASAAVTGAKMKFSAETADARFPTVFNNRNMKMTHVRALTTPDNLPGLIYPVFAAITRPKKIVTTRALSSSITRLAEVACPPHKIVAGRIFKSTRI